LSERRTAPTGSIDSHFGPQSLAAGHVPIGGRPMSAMTDSRWHISRLGNYPTARREPTRWRSRDLRGPLPVRVVHALEVAIRSLPSRGPWPEIDEEAWWKDILTDRRLTRSTAKMLSGRDEDARLRLDRCPAKSLTFSCRWCGERSTLTIAELARTFGPDRNVDTIGKDVLKCRHKGSRREGYPCPITYQAS
jgi:hypothetical protein